MCSLEILGLFIVCALGILFYFQWIYKYWERKHVPFVKPRFPLGNLENPLWWKHTPGVYVKKVYQELRSQGHGHGGFYIVTVPQYMPVAPNLIKNILQKDFHHFADRGFYYNETDDPLSATLFAIDGKKWRNLRTKLTPTFTSGKIKLMLNIVVDCGNQMLEAISEFYPKSQTINIKELLTCYATDVIGCCAFGLDCNSFKNPDSELRKYGLKMFEPSLLQNVKFIFAMAQPTLARALGVKVIYPSVAKFFMTIIKDVVTYRECNNIDRNDMMKLLIDLKNKPVNTGVDQIAIKRNGHGITFEELAAQAFTFFLGSLETSSTTMTFCLYELSKSQEIQQKARDEVNWILAKYGGKISYDAVMNMRYMSQVIDEALRKYPPLPFLMRRCVQDYNVPNTNVKISKGTDVVISVLGLHYDHEYFPNPTEFDPERFSENNRQNIQPFTFMPFGEGPRNCIGLRFGIMQTKVGLALLLKDYKFTLNKKTADPIVMDRYSFIATSEKGIFLDLEKL